MFERREKFLEEMISSLNKDMEDISAEVSVLRQEISKIEERLEKIEKTRNIENPKKRKKR